MHRASYRFMPPCGITETLSDVESVRGVHLWKKENGVFSSTKKSAVKVYVCPECGYIELKADRPKNLI